MILGCEDLRESGCGELEILEFEVAVDFGITVWVVVGGFEVRPVPLFFDEGADGVAVVSDGKGGEAAGDLVV